MNEQPEDLFEWRKDKDEPVLDEGLFSPCPQCEIYGTMGCPHHGDSKEKIIETEQVTKEDMDVSNPKNYTHIDERIDRENHVYIDDEKISIEDFNAGLNETLKQINDEAS